MYSFPTVPANATDSVLKVPEPSNVGGSAVSEDYGVFSSVPETGLPSSLSTLTPTPTADFNSLTSHNSSNSSTLAGVVSLISTPSVTTASTTIASTGSLLTLTPASSFPVVSVFKFGSAASTAVAPVSATLDLPSSESIAKKDTGFCISGAPFGVTAAATTSTGSSIFGFGATATGNSIFGSTAPPKLRRWYSYRLAWYSLATCKIFHI
nr:uncharacterized protein LOC125421508 [Ziziphus jujuba var. spinosa]